MKSEVLSHLVLRLVVGSFLFVHSLFIFIMIEAFIEKWEYYLNAFMLLDNSFLKMAVPHFPYIEGTVGVLLFVGILKRIFLILSLGIIVIVTTVHFILGQVEILSIIAFVLGALVSILSYFKQDVDYKALESHTS